jgi:hypothetical protein
LKFAIKGMETEQAKGQRKKRLTATSPFLPYSAASCPLPHAPCPALIIGKKRGKLPTASIIEFDLLFNAYADNQL